MLSVITMVTNDDEVIINSINGIPEFNFLDSESSILIFNLFSDFELGSKFMESIYFIYLLLIQMYS